MYCKSVVSPPLQDLAPVLIVAKCIVNQKGLKRYEARKKGINSSKVYCKWYDKKTPTVRFSIVLIVAKCSVNYFYCLCAIYIYIVLIVAKCIVNGKSKCF